MKKEIFEQPIVVAQTLQSYVRPIEGEVALPVADADLESIDRLTIVACGTSYYAGLVAKYWVEQFARVPVDIDVASEFRYREPGSGSPLAFAAEANAEEQQDKVSLGGRVSVSFAF